MRAEVLVIGSAVDELVCAHVLARSGRRVTVLEDERAGAEAGLEEGWVSPRIVRGLGLAAAGLELARHDPWLSVPLPAGGTLELWREPARCAEAIRRLSARDAGRWPEFCARMARLARLLEALYSAPPPDPLAPGARGALGLAALGLRVRRLGRQGVADLLRIVSLPLADLLDEWFECEALKGALAATGIWHTAAGPRSSGSALRLLHHHVGSPPGVFRPPLSNARRVLAALPGVEIRRGASVARILVERARARGVVLAGGEELCAPAVVSGLDPRRTLLQLADPAWLDPELVRALGHVRARGVTARATLALERPPGFARLAVAPSLEYLERAHDDAKRGGVSAAPYLEALDRGAGPDGRHRLEVQIQFAPYALAEGRWDEARRSALGALAARTLAGHAPALAGASVERVLAPPDLEAAHGWPEGQPYHAELALDQALWMRPLPALARYRTPIAGLYLCGPGTHPGGGIAGASGANAAREILRDFERGASRLA
jgi:phytoene dehydrogenase-like protein